MSKTSGITPKVLVVFGTRPEAIKLFPVVRSLGERSDVDTLTCVTAQHREMLDQVLDIAAIKPDFDLDIMRADQNLDELTGRLLSGIGGILDQAKPSRVVVQGDTATAMCGALSAYYRKIPVSHVEAGLRSYNIYHPWPEEVNRKIIGSIADQHFAPTETSANALRKENIAEEQISVTGNTVIDALLITAGKTQSDQKLNPELTSLFAKYADKKIIGVTSHRRENFGDGLTNIAAALKEIAARDDVALIFPVHLNPNVRAIMNDALAGMANVAMIEPLDYPNFVALLNACTFMLTDSGGVQEEAPALGKPVLVMRDTTERPEGIEAGTAKLVGTDKGAIVSEAMRLLDDQEYYQGMAMAHNPFGDGKASQRIADIIVKSLVG
ncbi:non-hydrolyzing UDP-N-acetylglucosamine 2-epimerase [Parasphingorhabdus halotolerans]|uniref:UDP-N-acetylglucosamine 2-epimerase (non-hydrolyzing) n=1 Tax=Parasphingorhabdus halotolerans TaxID=2725558 RepID=A0A6H2DN34_9SPHN|nr:UDP-N-acetylglucosamine 2-epimerase (non-hydrolyzing) [Parasphingorhabdus halotolerans]QJB69764.1 UDP-N-acetylglucosamine 2-epimerase (non-hydrolyzing) [Parasphingorhabdus halotolerans]